ncbi:MAG: anthranilate synthase component I family protein [Balneolaceae bacterium]|nr:MAG: anthranilate synthase component I family protein [Balneolaceae bacterium]
MNIHAARQTTGSLIALHREQQIILLESQMAEHPSSCSTYLAVGCRSSIEVRGRSVKLTKNGKSIRFESDPWEALKRFRTGTSGKIFGFLGYDLKNHTEKLTSENRSLTELPDLWFVQPEWLYRIGQNGTAVNDFTGELVNPEPVFRGSIPGYHFSDPVPLVGEDQYLQTVQKIQEMIREGRFYELNYSYPMQSEFSGDSFSLYSSMREVSPVPFASYISSDSFAVCCSSPERFLKKRGTRVQSEPIKGTAARSKDPQADRFNRELLLNEKNRAENLMIVDLVRHDLSSISVNGSVKVDKLFEIQSFGTVHQLISVVSSEVKEDTDPVDIVKHCFPMGSMTGAPKIEVMKVIDELENYRRGLYSGAIGWMDDFGDFDFNVVIRTALIQNSELIYPVGGAITSDSEPGQEWLETLIKASTLTHTRSGV